MLLVEKLSPFLKHHQFVFLFAEHLLGRHSNEKEKTLVEDQQNSFKIRFSFDLSCFVLNHCQTISQNVQNFYEVYDSHFDCSIKNWKAKKDFKKRITLMNFDESVND